MGVRSGMAPTGARGFAATLRRSAESYSITYAMRNEVKRSEL
jgi:hypothetical protein